MSLVIQSVLDSGRSFDWHRGRFCLSCNESNAAKMLTQ